MADLDRLEQLIAARRKQEPLLWERGKDGHVHECAHLGSTLIALADTYEDSDADCDYIEAACAALPELVAEIRALRKELGR